MIVHKYHYRRFETKGLFLVLFTNIQELHVNSERTNLKRMYSCWRRLPCIHQSFPVSCQNMCISHSENQQPAKQSNSVKRGYIQIGEIRKL